jgi:ribosomal protein S18 acetylase RimI-like enzyme
LSVDPHDRDFYVYEIYVVRKHRRKHIGSYLLDHAEKVAVEHGYSVALLKPYALEPKSA